MLSGFYKRFSLNNLREGKPLGQVATLLILMIVVILIMILTTVNLGQLAISTTNLSNVADGAALNLASQLATRSYSLYKGLGNSLCKCKSGGFGGLIGAIIGAIIVIVVTVVTYGAGTAPTMAAAFGSTTTMVAAGAIGGAIGGAAGSAYSGTNVLQGAIQGALIGASIGFGASSIGTSTVTAGSGATSSAGIVTTEGTVVQTSATYGAGSALGGGVQGNYVLQSLPLAVGTEVPAGATVLSGSVAVPSLTGAVVGGGLAASTATYNAYVADQNQSAAFAAASQMLNGLPDYDRFRESIFLQVFSQTVDDPNKDMDSDDLNGNGITNEKVPHFLYYWNDRTNHLKSIIPTLQNITNTFFNGTLKDFTSYIQGEIDGKITSYDSEMGTPIYGPGILSKAGTNMTEGGLIAQVAAALNPEFWNPKTDGSFDGIVEGFRGFIKDAQEFEEIDLSRLTSQWQTYISIFYTGHAGEIAEDGSKITDYYATLQEVLGYLRDWKRQISQKRNMLSPCAMGNYWFSFFTGEGESSCMSCGGAAFCTNACIVREGPDASPMPCKFDSTLSGGTLDYELDDEISASLSDIDSLITKLQKFRDNIKKYVQDMEDAYESAGNNYGGLNPAIYSWADSRGSHSITASVGNYKLARTVTTESGGWAKKEICVRMVDYSDNGANTWVQVTRQDPQSKDVKTGKVNLGMWNPFFNGKITKGGKAYYSYDRVGMAN
jgi:hypothetical protein